MHMKKVILYIFACCLLFVSCQQTPETPFVTDKRVSTNKLWEIIEDESVVENDLSDTPSTYKKTLQSKTAEILINVDAAIVLPDIKEFAIAKLRPSQYKQEEIDAIAYHLLGTEFYFRQEDKDLSKDEILQILLDIKSGKGSDLYELDPDAYMDSRKDEISYYERLYLTAPETT